MSPRVSTTVTSSRGGTTLLFHFFAYPQGRLHIRKFAAAAAAAATFANFPIGLSVIFSALASVSGSERGRTQRQPEGKGRKDISVLFFFSHNSKGRQAGKEGGRYTQFWQAGKDSSFASISNMIFLSLVSRSQEGKGGESAIL